MQPLHPKASFEILALVATQREEQNKYILISYLAKYTGFTLMLNITQTFMSQNFLHHSWLSLSDGCHSVYPIRLIHIAIQFL